MKKKFFLSLIFVLTVLTTLKSQNVAINDDGSLPNSYAVLDIKSSTNDKGILIPRLTTAQRTSISGLGTSEEGLTVYDSDENCYYLWDGTQWLKFGMSDEAWLLTGNSGTVSGTNFIGTTDNQDLDFRTNNTLFFRMSTKGQLEILNTGNSLFIGEEAGENDDLNDRRNVFIGYQSGYSSTDYWNNTYIGYQAGYNLQANQMVAIGYMAGRNSNINGLGNGVFIGNNAGINASGFGNVLIGYDAGEDCDGGQNVIIGHGAGNEQNITGSDNVIIGDNAELSDGSISHTIVLGSGVTADASYQVRLGGSDITSFYCQGAYAATTSQYPNVYVSSSGQIMRSTAKMGEWWSLTGNAGTIAGTNFLGTTDAQDLVLKTNSNEVMRLSQAGYVGIRNPLPTSLLHLQNSGDNADIKITEYQDNAWAPMIMFQKARGTSDAATALQDGDEIGKMYVYGYDGDSWEAAGSIEFIVDGTVADGQMPALIEFTLNNGSSKSPRWDMTYKSQLEPLNSGGSVFIGEQAGENDDLSDNMNVFIGYQTGYNITSAERNVFMGYQAGYNGNRDNNTYIGYQAGYNLNASSMVAIGYMAGRNSAINGIGNGVMIGYWAGINSSGFGNVLIGYEAGDDCDGGGCVIIGHDAGSSQNITGSGNTLIGEGADVNSGSIENSTALGNDALVTASDQVRIGNSSVTSIGGFADWSNVSDARFKKDVAENVPGLDFILKLRPVTYKLDINALYNFLGIPPDERDMDNPNAKILFTGFLAQDVEKAANSLGYDFYGVDKPKNDKDFYGLRYAVFTVPLVKAVQEQQQIISQQQNEILELKKQVENLKKQNEQILQQLKNQ